MATLGNMWGKKMNFIRILKIVFMQNLFSVSFLFLFFSTCQKGRQPAGNTRASSQSDDSVKTLRAHRGLASPAKACYFFHRVTDVEIKQGRAKWHAPATRSCAGQQTSVQWHPPRECLAGAHSVGRGCRCSLWLQPSGANLADTQHKHLYAK